MNKCICSYYYHIFNPTNKEEIPQLHILLLFSDVNECQKKPCASNSICENTVGSYTCPCRDGFVKRRNVCTGKTK